METIISATTLARELGDVLGRIRYRGESFVIERNGVAVARLIPAAGTPASVADALHAWRDAAEPDRGFAEALERIGAAESSAKKSMGLVIDTSALVALERRAGNWSDTLADGPAS
jgi:antitoxin (DNA-binding transcriptional repressor) of toxin-antitoxin stability system